MRILIVLCVISFSSCGFIASIKRDKYILSKGYNPNKDTAFILPYQYYIKHKNYVPIYRELNPANKAAIKISIAGFEHSDTIPMEKLFEQMTFVLSDSAYTISYGELRFSRNGISHVLKFGNQFSAALTNKGSFDFVKKKLRVIKKGDLLFFWNVNVIKNGVTGVLPSRMYYFK